MVDHGETQGAPIVEEPNPTYMNLLGRIDREAYYGALCTDFTLIRAGSLLRAYGGYLLLNALDILREPFSWNALKRALRRQEVTIEEVGEASGLMTPASINPEPIPIQVRVLLVGSPDAYAQLHTDDEDFRELFGVYRSASSWHVNGFWDEMSLLCDNLSHNYSPSDALIATFAQRSHRRNSDMSGARLLEARTLHLAVGKHGQPGMAPDCINIKAP